MGNLALLLALAVRIAGQCLRSGDAERYILYLQGRTQSYAT